MENSIVIGIYTKYSKYEDEIKALLESEKTKGYIDQYKIRFSAGLDDEMRENGEKIVVKYFSYFPRAWYADYIAGKVKELCGME